MDAAIAGLIGSLGGVIVGAATQAAQAARSRKWQVADQDRLTKEQEDARLWQERRVAYATFMDAEMNATEKITLAWLFNSANPPAQEQTDSDQNPVRDHALEFMKLTTEAISKVTRQAQEVLLVTGSSTVKNAVNAYLAAMTTFNPSAAHSGNPDRSEQGRDLLNRLSEGHVRFAQAARDELGISDTPTSQAPTTDVRMDRSRAVAVPSEGN